MTCYLIAPKTLTIRAPALFYNKNKGAEPVISIQYLCPKCAGITEMTNIDKIKNAEDQHPMRCHHCDAPFSKDALIKFARQKAEEMIGEALMQLKNDDIHKDK